MPCVEDVLKPGLRWLTIASGVLLSVGGVSNCVTLDPFTMFTGLFNFIFGLMIIGAIFNVEKILKQVAFLKHYWGRGLFFLYLGVPLLEGLWKTMFGSPAEADSTESSETSMKQTSELISAVVGMSLTASGLLNLSMACSQTEPDQKKDASALASSLMTSASSAGAAGV